MFLKTKKSVFKSLGREEYISGIYFTVWFLKCLIKVSHSTANWAQILGVWWLCLDPRAPPRGCSAPNPLTGCAGSAASPAREQHLPGKCREQGRAGETVGENWRLRDFWNEGYKFENGSAWESESIVRYKYLFQRSPEHETSSSVIQVRFQGSSIVGVLISAVVCSSKVFCLTSPEFILVNESMFIFEECPCLDKKRFFNIMKRLGNSSTFFPRQLFAALSFTWWMRKTTETFGIGHTSKVPY